MSEPHLEIVSGKLTVKESATGKIIAEKKPIGTQFLEFRRVSKNCIIVREDYNGYPLESDGCKPNIYCLDDKLQLKWRIQMPFPNDRDSFPNSISWNIEIIEKKNSEGYLELEWVDNPNTFTCSCWGGFTITVEYETGKTISSQFTK